MTENSASSSSDGSAATAAPRAAPTAAPRAALTGPRAAAWSGRLAQGIRDTLPYLGLILLVVFFTLTSPYFLTLSNIERLITDSATLIIVAMGMTLVILLGEIDLSVAAVTGLLSVIVAQLMLAGVPWPVATALTVLISVGIGTLNGLLTVLGGIHSFVVTLGMNAIATGLAFVLTGAVSVPIQNTTFLDLFYWVAVFGIPVPLIAIVIAFIACFVALRRTAFGRELYAIGANMEAARLSAVPVKRDKILVFVIMGLLVGIGGILAAARLGSGSPPTNLALTLDAIAAVIIGGASLFGGRASLVRSVTGALLIGVLNNGMVLLNITTDAQFIIKGVIILFAVVLERVAAESSP